MLAAAIFRRFKYITDILQVIKVMVMTVYYQTLGGTNSWEP